MDLNCPICQHALAATDSGYICSGCQHLYIVRAHCPDCHQPLDVLKACGATDYFCQHGHGLISKKRLLWFPEIVEKNGP